MYKQSMPAIPEINFSTDIHTLKYFKCQNEYSGLDKLLNESLRNEDLKKQRKDNFRTNLMIANENL